MPKAKCLVELLHLTDPTEWKKVPEGLGVIRQSISLGRAKAEINRMSLLPHR